MYTYFCMYLLGGGSCERISDTVWEIPPAQCKEADLIAAWSVSSVLLLVQTEWPGRKKAQRWWCFYWNDNSPSTLPRWDVRVDLQTHRVINQYLEMVWKQFRDWAGRANRVRMMTLCTLSQVRASPVAIEQTSGSRLCGLKRQTGCRRSALSGC